LLKELTEPKPLQTQRFSENEEEKHKKTLKHWGREGRSCLANFFVTGQGTKLPPVPNDVCSNTSLWAVGKIKSDCIIYKLFGVNEIKGNV
jgi:hypothetical protein